MKLLCFAFLLSLVVLQPRTDDPLDRSVNLLKQGNLTELYKTFAPNIDLTIADNEGTYPKEKAQTILNAFFAKNQTLSGKLIHKLDSNPDLLYAVVVLATKGGNYRVAISLNNNKGTYQLTELSIQEEKAQ